MRAARRPTRTGSGDGPPRSAVHRARDRASARADGRVVRSCPVCAALHVPRSIGVGTRCRRGGFAAARRRHRGRDRVHHLALRGGVGRSAPRRVTRIGNGSRPARESNTCGRATRACGSRRSRATWRCRAREWLPSVIRCPTRPCFTSRVSLSSWATHRSAASRACVTEAREISKRSRARSWKHGATERAFGLRAQLIALTSGRSSSRCSFTCSASSADGSSTR